MSVLKKRNSYQSEIIILCELFFFCISVFLDQFVEKTKNLTVEVFDIPRKIK